MNTHRPRLMFRRQNLTPLTATFLLLLAAVRGFVASRAQSGEKEEREVVEKIPKHLPIKVKIKKPEKLKDSKNEEWPDDMEIEVTNTGAKPIYFLSINLDLPDVLAPNGNNYAFSYNYGRINLAAFVELVRPDDVPLQPGETVTLTDTDKFIKGWKSLRRKGKVTNPKKLDLIFQVINFGDGTGFMGRDGTSMPRPRQRSSNASPAGGDVIVGQTTDSADSPPRAFPDSAWVPLQKSI